MARPSAWWLLLGLLGFGAGWTGATGYGQLWAEYRPEGWSRLEPRALYHSPDNLGSLPLSPRHWSVDSYRALLAEAPAQRLEGRFRLPPDGRLLLRPGTEVADMNLSGPGLLLEEGRAPRGVQSGPRGETALSCTGALPPVEGPVVLALAQVQGGFEAQVGGQSLRCSASIPSGGVSLDPGLGRVRVEALTLDGVPLPPPISGAWLPLGGLLGAALVLGLGALERRRLPLWAVVATASPLLVALLLCGHDFSDLYESLRLPTRTGVRQLPLLFGLIPTLLLKGVVHSLPVARGWRGLWIVGAGALLGLLFPAEQLLARLYFGAAGACAAGLLWANLTRWRGYNALSLLLFAGLLGSLEWGLRWTQAGLFWQADDAEHGGGSMSVLAAEFEALDAGIFLEHPTENFPAAFPPRGERPRIACLGGSSTGGAFENDSMDQLYPAMLEQRLQGWEVVNQGAPSWTTFHMRVYLERWLEALDPQILTVYVGVNESADQALGYATLYDRWKAGRLSTGPGLLDRVRLFQGLRYLSAGLRGGGSYAVSPDELRENLEAIADAMAARGGRVLLASEASQPSTEAFAPWYRELEALAGEREELAYVDLASELVAMGPALFLDQNHLTEAGHQAVAAGLARELEALGWVR